MPVLVLSEVDRGDGTVLATLSQDGVRFTAVVSSSLLDSGHKIAVYQTVADHMVAEQARVRAIRELPANRGA